MSPFPAAALDRQRRHGRRQRIIALGFIAAYQEQHGWAPSVREVAEALGVGQSTAHKHLRMLHDEGALELGGGPRMIRLTNGHIDLR